jgi:hypothetical protein
MSIRALVGASAHPDDRVYLSDLMAQGPPRPQRHR